MAEFETICSYFGCDLFYIYKSVNILNEEGLDQLKIEAIKPEALHIDGLSLFLSKSEKLNVKVVNKDVVLYKSIDQKKNCSNILIVNFQKPINMPL